MRVIELLNKWVDCLLNDNKWENIQKLHETYIADIKTLDDNDLELFLTDNEINIDVQTLSWILSEVIKSIHNAINFYYNGHPKKAIDELKKILEKAIHNNIDIKYSKYLLEYNLTNNSHVDYYRMRQVNSSEISSPESIDLFHIPFNQRRNIGKQRFSISGFPCLYLGKSIQVCFNELDGTFSKDVKFKTYITRYQTTKKIKILNLTIPHKFTEDIYKNHAMKMEALSFLFTYPIRHTCLLNVNRRFSKRFTPEYIIPQLLLQLIRETSNDFEAIMYTSTRASRKNKQSIKSHNLVIPVKDISTEENIFDTAGHCSELKSMFHATKPIVVSSYRIKSLELNERTLSTLGLSPL